MTPDRQILDEFDAVPVNRHFGFVLEEQGTSEAVVCFEPHGAFVQETGVIHGGVLTTLADTAAVYALRGGMPASQAVASIELKVNFLSPARADRGPLIARAAVLRRGRRVGVCETELTQRGVLVAKALLSYHIFDGPV